MTKSMPRTDNDTELGRPVCSGQLARISRGHALVIGAVHHEHRPRCKTSRCVDRTEPTELAGPVVEVRRKPNRANRTDLTRMFEEPSRL